MNKENLQDLLLFYSSKEEKYIKLKEYIERMQPNQKDIYYASGDSINSIKLLPQVEMILEKGYEIIYLTEYLDEFVIKTIGTYQEKNFISAVVYVHNAEKVDGHKKVKIDIENKNNIFSKTVLKLDAISPLKILSRGYSVTEKDGEIVQSINDVDIGDNICVRLNKGKLNCSIISKEE